MKLVWTLAAAAAAASSSSSSMFAQAFKPPSTLAYKESPHSDADNKDHANPAASSSSNKTPVDLPKLHFEQFVERMGMTPDEAMAKLDFSKLYEAYKKKEMEKEEDNAMMMQDQDEEEGTLRGAAVKSKKQRSLQTAATDIYGDTFHLGFLDNLGVSFGEVPRLFLIESPLATPPITVDIEFFDGTPPILGVVLNAGGITEVTLPATAGSGWTKGGISNNGIKVTSVPHSGKDFGVFMNTLISNVGSSDSALAIPTSNLGYEYVAVTREPQVNPIGGGSLDSQILIVGTQAGTVVNLEFPDGFSTGSLCLGGSYSHGSTLATLNEGEGFLYSSDSQDLTGTIIKADHPIVVISGNEGSRIPDGSENIDVLMNFLEPISAWGSFHVIPDNPVPYDGTYIRVTAIEDNTVVLFDGNIVTSINAQDNWETPTPVRGPHSIMTYKGGTEPNPVPVPSTVKQFMLGEVYLQSGSEQQDPSMNSIAPWTQLPFFAEFYIPATSNFSTIWINIVADEIDVSGAGIILVDNIPFPALSPPYVTTPWVNVPGTPTGLDLWAASVYLSGVADNFEATLHSVFAATAPCMVTVHGVTDPGTAAASFSYLASRTFPVVTSAGPTVCECESNGTPCGSSTSDECDEADTCYYGSCNENYAPTYTTCGWAGECEEDDLCDGMGNCVPQGFSPNGAPCGDSTDDECNNPDTCDGSGNCLPNFAPSSTMCGGPPGDCQEQDMCSGSGSCSPGGPSPGGTPCGLSTSDQCDNPNTCDTGGNCQDNHEPTSTPCNVGPGGDCWEQDFCDGEGACAESGPKVIGTNCGTQACPQFTDCVDICFQPDTCDGSGLCVDNTGARNGELCENIDDPCINDRTCFDRVCQPETYAPSSTSCGASSDTECTNPDTCSGWGDCLENDEPFGVPCGNPPLSECDGAFGCDGSGDCSAFPDAPPGTPCGDSGNSCKAPDQCGGDASSGLCIIGDFYPAGTPCGTNGECQNDDQCDGEGNCVTGTNVADGTPCGSQDDTACTDPNTCQSGVCADNDAPTSTPCNSGNPAPSSDCEAQDFCDGSGGCTSNFQPVGTPCGDQSDTDCSDPDTCNAGGTCVANDAPTSTPCGDQTDNQCNGANTCDGSGGCLENLAPVGTPCDAGQPADDADCDADDTCNGSGTCVANYAPEFDPCGSDFEDDCNNPDSCNGSGTCLHRFEPVGVDCGGPPEGGACDAQNTCSGTGTCVDNFAPSATPCGGDPVEECDAQNFCAGDSLVCVENFAPLGDPCGSPPVDECDAPDTCDGTGGCIDNFAPTFTICGDSPLEECDAINNCDGSGTCIDNFEPAGTPCGNGQTCDGNSPDCPAGFNCIDCPRGRWPRIGALARCRRNCNCDCFCNGEGPCV